MHGDVSLRLVLYGKGIGVAGDAVRVTAIPNLVERAADVNPDANADRTSSAPDVPQAVSTTAASKVAVPPSTVHEVQPRIPDGIRSRIRDRIMIPVDLEINAQGRVTRATAETSGSDGLHRYL